MGEGFKILITVQGKSSSEDESCSEECLDEKFSVDDTDSECKSDEFD